jgi:predicted lipid-binding transport protein (Tim44 family)
MDPVLLIFGGLAAFILFRLFSVLGTRTGHEQRPRDLEGVQRASKQADARSEQPAQPTPLRKQAAVSANAAPLRAADPSFDEKAYLDGARVAYEMIVEAFAAGDLKSIRRFLGQSVYEAFKTAIGEREAKGLTSELKFVGIESAAISSSSVDGDQMTAVTDFASNQVRVTRDKDSNVVEGDPSRIDLVRDRWTFARSASSNDPNWVLVATGGAA